MSYGVGERESEKSKLTLCKKKCLARVIQNYLNFYAKIVNDFKDFRFENETFLDNFQTL